jgi:hypothetical protein
MTKHYAKEMLDRNEIAIRESLDKKMQRSKSGTV